MSFPYTPPMSLRKKILLRFSMVSIITGSALFLAPAIIPSAGASPPALQACTANNVAVVVRTSHDDSQWVSQTFQLTNIGSTTCGMEGYPGLKFFTATKLDTYVNIRHHASVYSLIAPKLLAIGPQSVVSFGLSYRIDASVKRSAERDCDVTSLLLQLPLAPSATGDFSLHDKFNACESGNVVAVTAVENRSTPRLAST
jgi:hypothetical protein